MSLRYKSLIIITCFVLILFFVFLLFSNFIFINFTKKNEERYALENVQRVKNLIEKEIIELDSFSKGYAFIDQSHNFINSPNQKYIDDNLKETDFNYFNFSFIIFTDLDGKEIFSKSNCFEDSDHFNNFLNKLLENRKIKETLKNKSETRGVFGFNESEFIISVNPVYDNYKKEPSNGFLIIGREFDKIGLFKVKLNPNSSTYELFADAKNNSADKKIKSELILSNQIVTFDKERAELISYLLIRNINGQPEIILKIIQSSGIFKLSREASILYAAISGIFVFILISLLLIIFERFVISKIIKLNQNVGLVIANKRVNLNGSKPEKLKSADEVDSLNTNIYKLLSLINYINNHENLIVGIFNEYLQLTEKKADDFINNTLRKIGSFSGSDRASILLFSKKNGNTEVFYDWHAPNIEADTEKYKSLSFKDIKWLYNMVQIEGKFFMGSIGDIPEDQKKLRELLVAASTKSFLAIAMIFENNLTGLVKFDAVLEEKEWSSEDVELLKNITGILIYTIARFKPGIFKNN
ncbi:MAG: CHASE4 domain-containing protein [Candidatus Humimicrobiaceae bacterium]